MDSHKIPGTIARIMRHVCEAEGCGHETVTTDPHEATVVTSELSAPNAGADMHALVLDLDYAAQLVPSSTPGHFHLYLDKPVPKDKMLNVLKALAEAGLIEEKYYQLALRQGYSSVRVPWKRKPAPPEAPAKTSYGPGPIRSSYGSSSHYSSSDGLHY